ncbi:hypothetical protein GCM10008933_15050 [Paenibacillus motobuensis]|uniref:Uncharacterized protein n=1 Tax=Paenibacillus motobuensis TaxID=295324 RepID=A0ABN0Y6Y3_9BACL
MIIWNKDFDKKNLKDILKLTDIYVEKRIIVKNNKEVLKYIQGHLEAASECNDFTLQGYRPLAV